MSINNLKNTVFKILKADDRIWNKEKNELNQTLLIDLLDKIDEKIIGILLENEELRDKFFIKIKDCYVFKTNDFKFFLEENKISNSYTKYKNQIGLTDGKRFLKDSGDVVLDFPFKDCVLEGGQSTEEGEDKYFEYSDKAQKYEEKTAKRKEIFFNSVLAQDEIDRLFDEKALVAFKRFNKDGENEVKEIKRDANGTIKENLIIKGNNLLALHSLKSQFAGKVKLIYIDPPYNTGNDGFKYNDNFNHSTWLTFMKNRLEVARELLRDDGSIFINIDEGEAHYCKLLLDDIFGKDKFLNEIIWRYRTYQGQVKEFFPKKHDTIFWYIKRDRPAFKVSYQKNYKDTVDYSRWNNFFVEDKIIYPHYPKTDSRFTAYLNKYIKENGEPKDGDIIYQVRGYIVDDVWEDIKAIDAKDKGQKTEFTGGQKPEELIERIIHSITQPNDIILDFHLGSGTTAAVAHKMNRQYIGIEQMDYIKNITKERLKKVIDGEQGGISKSVNWQGGGDFIYFELAKHNETAKEKILNCQNLKELEVLFDELYDKYFLNYNLKIKEFKEKVLKEEEFKNLELIDQKKMFLTMLDLNQMYVNKSEMADKNFAISQQDQELTKEFYKSEV